MSESVGHKSGESHASYEFATDDTCGLILKLADQILDDSDQELEQFQQVNLRLDQPNFAYLEGETDVQLIIIRFSETSQAQAANCSHRIHYIKERPAFEVDCYSLGFYRSPQQAPIDCGRQQYLVSLVSGHSPYRRLYQDQAQAVLADLSRLASQNQPES